MSKALNHLREELYKISNIDFEDDNDLYMDDKLIEFFNSIKYLRLAPEEEIIINFRSILYSDKYQAIKLLFFIRDKRNGLGERRIFRVLIKYLEQNEREILSKNLDLISKYGRWDDYYSLFDTNLEMNVIRIFKNQLQKDISSTFPSNLAKWLKSENASSKNTRYLAYKTRSLLGYSSKEYRMLLTNLRKKLNIIENNMRTLNYDIINYKSLSPSVLYKHKKAFLKHDRENFINSINVNKNNILEKLDKVMYNYAILKNNNFSTSINIEDSLKLKNINYIYNKNNIINKDNLINLLNSEISDTLKEVRSVEDTFIINGLEEKEDNENFKEIKTLLKAILLYKKINLNFFKNYYMYFDKIPKFKKITEDNILKEIESLFYDFINININFEAAIDLLLYTAIKQNIELNSIPKSILFIYNTERNLELFKFDQIVEKWLKAGYIMPKIKFWNLYNLNKDFYIDNSNEYIYIQGYNKNIWSFLLEGKEINQSIILLEKFKKLNYEINMI